ncbi:MAG: hypothetical protein J7L55_05910 [Desulfurococcales archaeon]|nr:hypothetical protein [Desulfurococcales archaeon]
MTKYMVALIMRKKLIYTAAIVAVAAIAIIGALLTPTEVAAINPYVVGGELEVPQQSTPNYTALAIGIAAAALAAGAFVAWKMKE